MSPRILVLCIALLPACAVTVGAVRPVPNVLLPRSSQSLALRIAPEVPDAFDVPDDYPSLELKLTSWRQSMTIAFRNGFARYYASPQPKSDLVLVVLHADPHLVNAGRGPFGGTLVHVQLRFQAELLDANEHVLKTWADTVVSRNTFTTGDYAGNAVGSAIEAMYEEIANGMPHLDDAATR
jgi:hypothetical protein